MREAICCDNKYSVRQFEMAVVINRQRRIRVETIKTKLNSNPIQTNQK